MKNLFIGIILFSLLGCKSSKKTTAYSYQVYEQESKLINEQLNKLFEEYRSYADKNDTVMIREIQAKTDKLFAERTKLGDKFVKNNRKDFISLAVLQTIRHNPDYSSKLFKKRFKSLSKNIRNSKDGKEIKESLDIIENLKIGKKAPDFSAPNPNGDTISLYGNLGKITIIDFWASWCLPCKEEHKNTVEIYNKYHKKGLNIIGVALDRDRNREQWIDTIKEDNLVWTQVSNLEFWDDPIVKLYNIAYIPATFILDSKGRIIAKDLRGTELNTKIAELLD